MYKVLALNGQAIWQMVHDTNTRLQEISLITDDNPVLREFAKSKFS